MHPNCTQHCLEIAGNAESRILSGKRMQALNWASRVEPIDLSEWLKADLNCRPWAYESPALTN